MKNLFLLLFILISLQGYGQSDLDGITSAVNDYIEGTANGEPERLRRSFHPEFNLYHVGQDTVRIWSGEQYISNITPGKKSNRVGRIVSMDYEGNAATAKVEILMPARKRIYIDYLLLLKYQGSWKIIQKSFTYRNYPE